VTRRAFTLVELLLAVFILGIGVLGVAALLPSAIALQQRANDDVVGPIVADNAIAIIRSKLSPEMFGTLEEFNIPDDISSPVDPATGNGSIMERVPNVPGDWGWKRPSVLVSAGGANAASARLIGAIDIFGGTAAQGGVPAGLSVLSETRLAGAMQGIPYSRRTFDPTYRVLNPVAGVHTPPSPQFTPAILITQGERCYPMSSEATYPQPRPQYVWDCMFRRFEGRILVAIFVYRVSTAGGDIAGISRDVGSAVDRNALAPYRVGLPTAGSGPNGVPPAIPMSVSLPLNLAWRYGGPDANPATVFDNARLAGTDPDGAGAPRELAIAATWQAPGQWIVDEYNVVHKVASGRRTTREGPVFLTRPVPELEPSRALFGVGAGAQLNEVNMRTRGVTQFWFVPTRDQNGFILQPVFATVKEL
jgi:prepilin-type N-terminal cleavage/methylation domain-containing protein